AYRVAPPAGGGAVSGGSARPGRDPARGADPPDLAAPAGRADALRASALRRVARGAGAAGMTLLADGSEKGLRGYMEERGVRTRIGLAPSAGEIDRAAPYKRIATEEAWTFPDL